MTHAARLLTPERLTTERLHTLLAHMRLWVLELALWFAALCGDAPMAAAIRADLRENLRLARRGLAAVCLLLAARRCAQPPHMQGHERPANAPRGVRRPHNTCRHFRIITRRVPGGRGLRARCAALRAAMEDADATIARMVTLLEATPVAAYIMACAPRDRCVALFLAQPVVADSS